MKTLTHITSDLSVFIQSKRCTNIFINVWVSCLGFLNRCGFINAWNALLSKGFVKTSAKFSFEPICLNKRIFPAIASLTLWWLQACHFFFKTLDSTAVLSATDWLSPCIIEGPSIGTPDILNWHLNSITVSAAILAAANSEPQVEVSTVLCLLLVQQMGVLFKNTKITVTNLLVVTSLTWSASRQTVILTGFPFGSNTLGTTCFPITIIIFHVF